MNSKITLSALLLSFFITLQGCNEVESPVAQPVNDAVESKQEIDVEAGLELVETFETEEEFLAAIAAEEEYMNSSTRASHSISMDKYAFDKPLLGGGKRVRIYIKVLDVKNAGTDDPVRLFTKYTVTDPKDRYFRMAYEIVYALNDPKKDDNNRNTYACFTYWYVPGSSQYLDRSRTVYDQCNQARVGVYGGDGIKVDYIRMYEYASTGSRSSYFSYEAWADGVTYWDGGPWTGKEVRRWGYTPWELSSTTQKLLYK